MIKEIRSRLLLQLEGQADSAIVPVRDLAAWVVRCNDILQGPVYRWAIVGAERLPRSDHSERFRACDDAARALVAAVARSTENAA